MSPHLMKGFIKVCAVHFVLGNWIVGHIYPS